MREDFYKLITEKQIQIEYYEDDEGVAQISVYIPDEKLEESFTDDMYEELLAYLEESMIIATFAGFEAPSEFYSQIKQFVEMGDPFAQKNN